VIDRVAHQDTRVQSSGINTHPAAKAAKPPQLIHKFDPVQFAAGQLSFIFFFGLTAAIITGGVILMMVLAGDMIGMGVITR
jgi:hypothetical protein